MEIDLGRAEEAVLRPWLRLRCAATRLRLAAEANRGIDTFVLRPPLRNVHALRAFRRAGFMMVEGDVAQALRGLRAGTRSRSSMRSCCRGHCRHHGPCCNPEAGCDDVFLATEFTNLHEPQLISAGAVSADGAEFYCAINGWSDAAASDFVRRIVVPLLASPAALSQARTAQAFGAWLAARAAQGSLTVVTDSAYARWALADLFGGDGLPHGISWQRVPLPYERLDAVTAELGPCRHHALDDAQRAALRLAHAGSAAPLTRHAPAITGRGRAGRGSAVRVCARAGRASAARDPC